MSQELDTSVQIPPYSVDSRIAVACPQQRSYTISIQSATMYDLTGFQRDVLYVIAGLSEPHGVAVKDELENYYETDIYYGQLYPNLDTLADKGLIDKGQKDGRTNMYTVTDRGRRELKARRDWEARHRQ